LNPRTSSHESIQGGSRGGTLLTFSSSIASLTSAWDSHSRG
jgi:hypothetical protein